jgi:hypothetical protein
MSKVHVIKDENLGGVLREFVEVDQKAKDGDFAVFKTEHKGITPGKPYEITVTGGMIEFYDDNGEEHWWTIPSEELAIVGPTDIVHIDDPSGQPKRYRMVDRKAEVGERIIIIDADIVDYLSNYKNGDIFVVRELNRKYRGGVEAVSPNEFDDKINVILPYEYRVLEPVHECDQCGKALGDNACTNSKGGSYCSAKCAKADEETSPTIHEMLANLSEQIVKLNRRIDRLADANEQAVATVARDVERVDADLIKLRKEFEDSKDVNLTLSSELVAKLIEKGLNG